MMTLEQIVIFSPLPPSKTGIADYMVEIGLEIEKLIYVIYVIANEAPVTSYIPSNGKVITIAEFERNECLHSLPLIYHLGNNIQHEYIFRSLVNRPGIVVMHDFSVHHLLVELTLANGEHQLYEDLMEYNYGDLGVKIARRRNEGYFNEILQFILPLNKSVVDSSKATIVHSNDSYYKIKDLVPSKPAIKIPFPFKILPGLNLYESKDAAKREMEIENDTLIFASFGFATPPKQIEFICKSLSSLKNKFDKFEYWVVGEVAEAVPLKQILRKYNLEKEVKVFGYVGFEKMHHYMQACDVALSLRYPSAGETSAVLYRAMGLGTCCVVFDYSSYSDIRDDAVEKISLNTFDTNELEDKLLLLSGDRDRVRKIGNNAKWLIETEHKASISAEMFLSFVEKVMSM
ncbi:glycosyltransferase [Desulfogranum marinum]|uniref:glycosyltransferase n=1 Tax=Desulfogranum marinum TaxID=453220 RepID=UPI00196440F7|nr:glycosyltransferase [Desulfogranum marinum]MBM9513027.1 glycosyltransferase [Desulfogranum marinum]